MPKLVEADWSHDIQFRQYYKHNRNDISEAVFLVFQNKFATPNGLDDSDQHGSECKLYKTF